MQSNLSSATSIGDQIRRLRVAQQAWARLSVGERLRPLDKLRKRFAADHERLAAAVATDIGKPLAEAIGGEILPTADAFWFLQKRAVQILKCQRVARSLRPLWLWGQKDTIHRRARGVVGIIGTWNYPLFLNGVQIAQALTAGNAVLWKPSEVAPASAAILLGMFQEAGYPADLLQSLAPTRENGSLLVEADIDHLIFTGSAAIGRTIAQRLGERLVSSTMELSGVDSMIVLKDADVALASRAAWFGATVNSGQTCIAVRRVFVAQERYEDFCEALGKLAAKAEVVALAMASQVEQAEEFLESAVGQGARLLNSPAGRPPGGAARQWRPAALIDAKPAMAFFREASFAPMVAVMPFESVDQAMAMEQECPYALGASIFTGNMRQAEEIASRFRCGLVTVNDVVAPTAHPATPFGGHCQSGWGVTQGSEGLLEMTVPQVVSSRRDDFRPHYDMAAGQGGGDHEELLRGLLASQHGASLGQRLRGWLRLLGAARAEMRRAKRPEGLP